MLKVGITGGIGSGKSIVCQVFQALGIPVFRADDGARYVMEHDPELMAAIIALLGDVYAGGKLNRPMVSSLIYNDPARLQQLNALVHPETIAFGERWMAGQSSPYVMKEAAIFFESGTYRQMDVMIGVFAPVETRIARAMNRGGLPRDKVLSIIAQQMDDDEKMKLCDHLIINDDVAPVLPQVERLHDLLLQQAAAISG